MAFDLSQYETVDSRIDRFYSKHENGRIITDLIAYSDNQFIVKAYVYRDAADEHPAATGFAEEKVGSNPVNRTSALENCETSAIGRALANLNFAPKGQRPSVEEMTKADRYEVANGTVPREAWKNGARGAWAEVGDITPKQLDYVRSIIDDAALGSGWYKKPEVWGFVTEWLHPKEPRYTPITKVEDLSKTEASKIINDKRNSDPRTGVTKLQAFLQSKQPADYDPWETPTTKEVI